MKKNTTITNSNIHLIMFKVKQFISRMGVIAMQTTYPTNIALAKYSKSRIICQSNVSYLDNKDCRIEVDIDKSNGNKYIRINYQKFACGFLLKVGDKIRFAGEHIYLKTEQFPYKGEFQLTTWERGNQTKCEKQTEWNKKYSDDYWKGVEEELDNELSNGLFDNSVNAIINDDIMI